LGTSSENIIKFNQLKRRKVLTLTLFILLFPIFTNITKAQNTGALRGVITDSTTGEVLPFSNVLIEKLNTGTSANSQGYFFIPSLPAKKYYKVTFSFIGYKPKIISVYISPKKITDLKIGLIPTSIMLQPIEKVGERTAEKNAPNLGLERISAGELEIMPKSVEEDVFRSIQYLPGVQSTSDISARYYVRGSPSNENLVEINGMAIYNPFHALGIFSVIDPDMVNTLEFYKGDFPANYGGRLSSVTNIITKDGNKNKFGAIASSSLLAGKVLAEGPIPFGSFIITGRKSYYSDIYKKFLNNESAPVNFYDLSFKLNYANPNFINGSKIIISDFSSGDRLLNSNLFVENVQWYNNVFGINWYQLTNSPLFFEMSLYSSNFNGNVNPKLSGSNPKSNQVNDITFKADFSYVFNSKDEIDAGWEIKNIDTYLNLQNGAFVSDISESGTNINFYALYKFIRFSNFGANVGTRIDLTGLSQSQGSNLLFGPRVNLTYNLSQAITLKAAWGIYHQQITTLSDANQVISIFEPWIITPEYLQPAASIHYSGGIHFDFSQAVSLDVQTYYKVLQNIAAINYNRILPTDPDLVAGSGVSYGWEFLFKYLNDPINFTGSYTLSWAYNNVNGWVYYPEYDVRDAVNLILEVNFGDGWYASAAWTFNTGYPFTQSLGYYNKFYFQNFYSDWQIYENYEPFSILSDLNLARLPDYHRLDLSVTKKFNISFLKFTADISVLNLYNRKNIFYFERTTGKRVNMLPILPMATLKMEL